MSELIERVAAVLVNSSIISALSAGTLLGFKRYGDFLRRENEKNHPRFQEPRAGQTHRAGNKHSTRKVR